MQFVSVSGVHRKFFSEDSLKCYQRLIRPLKIIMLFYPTPPCCPWEPPFCHRCLPACAQSTLGLSRAAATNDSPQAGWNWRSPPATESGPPLCFGHHLMAASHHVWPPSNPHAYILPCNWLPVLTASKACDLSTHSSWLLISFGPEISQI